MWLTNKMLPLLRSNPLQLCRGAATAAQGWFINLKRRHQAGHMAAGVMATVLTLSIISVPLHLAYADTQSTPIPVAPTQVPNPRAASNTIADLPLAYLASAPKAATPSEAATEDATPAAQAPDTPEPAAAPATTAPQSAQAPTKTTTPKAASPTTKAPATKAPATKAPAAKAPATQAPAKPAAAPATQAAAPPPAPAKKPLSEIAAEVIAGQWGSGATRTARLSAAGYDPAQVQALVNQTLGAGSSNSGGSSGSSGGGAAAAPAPAPAATKAPATNAPAAAANRLVIPALGVNAPFTPNGIVNNALVIPDNPSVLTIYSGGASPCATVGTVLLAGHVSNNGVNGALHNLKNLGGGSLAYLGCGNGEVSTWRVTGSTVINQSNTSWSWFTSKGKNQLIIITCEQDANGGYTENRVVTFARVS